MIAYTSYYDDSIHYQTTVTTKAVGIKMNLVHTTYHTLLEYRDNKVCKYKYKCSTHYLIFNPQTSIDYVEQ